MHRLVLHPDALPSEVETIAQSLGWQLVNPPASESDEVRRDFLSSKGLRTRWIDDTLSGWSYLLAPDSYSAAWSHKLMQAGLVVTRDSALTVFRSMKDTSGLGEATLLLGLFTYGPFDIEVFASISAALLSSSEEVRHAALTAITYSTWDEFGPLLREGLAEAQPTPEVLREAREIADRLDAEGWHRAYYACDP